MSTARPLSTIDRLQSLLRTAICLMLVLAPLPFGGVPRWSVLVAQVYSALLGGVAAVVLVQDGGAVPRKARWLLVPVGVVLAIGLLQLLPLPTAWIDLLAGPTAESRRHLAEVLPETARSFAPLSLSPAATVDALLRFVCYVLVGLAVVVVVRDRGQMLRIAAVIAASGAIQGFYGAAEYLSGHQHVLGYPKIYFLDSATGTFINRNHFAGYLAMTLPFAVALALDAYRRWSIARAERGTALFFDGSAVGIVAGVSATSIIWTGIVLSDSRAGFAVSLVAVAVVLFSVSSRHARILIALAIVVPTLVLLGQEIRAPAERFAAPVENLASVGGRVPVWRATLGIVADYQPFGSGYGTFGAVFPLYRPPQIEKRWDHVHNDWLESASDGGVVVTLAMLAMLWISLRRMDDAPQSPAPDALWAGVTASLTAVAIHSLVDFPLRIPAVALLCATVVGLSCVAGTAGAEHGTAEPRPLRSIR